MPFTKPRRVQIVNGSTVAMYTADRPMIELSRFHPSISRKVEMIIASAGIIWTMRIVTMKAARLRNRNRVTASAARKAKTSASTTVMSGDLQRVQQRGDERRTAVVEDDRLVVLEREVVGPEVQLRAAHLAVRLERGVHHPVDREHRGEEHDRGGDAEPRSRRCACGADGGGGTARARTARRGIRRGGSEGGGHRSSSLMLRRMYRMEIAASSSTMITEMAPPMPKSPDPSETR